MGKRNEDNQEDELKGKKRPVTNEDPKPPKTVEEADRRQEKKRRRVEAIIRRQLWRGKGGEDDGRHPPATPWLLIRYSIADLGPRPIPSGQVHWQSPDIWIESSDPDGNGVPGENNFVHARILNLGMAPAVPMQVDFYWSDPYIGLGPAQMNHIGTEWVAVGSIDSVDVRCNTPWVPEFVNKGQDCVIVNCSNHILDPVIHPFEPRLDRHAGQRNVTVLQCRAADTLQLVLAAANVFALAAELDFRATVARFQYDAQFLARHQFRTLIDHALEFDGGAFNTAAEISSRYRHGTAEYRSAQRVARLATRQIEPRMSPAPVRQVHRGAAPRLKAEVSESLGVAPPLDVDGDPLARWLTARAALVQGSGCLPEGSVPLMTGIRFRGYEAKRVSLELRVPADAEPGEFLVFDITQSQYGMLAGGYTIVVRITP